MEGLRRKLKERFELFEVSRPETKSFEQIGISLKQTFIAPLTSSYHTTANTQQQKISSMVQCKHYRRLIRKKQRCYNSARRNGKEQVWRRFRHLRNLVHRELQLAHKQYVNNS